MDRRVRLFKVTNQIGDKSITDRIYLGYISNAASSLIIGFRPNSSANKAAYSDVKTMTRQRVSSVENPTLTVVI